MKCVHAAVGLCSAGCLLSLWAPLAGDVLAAVGVVCGLAGLARYVRPLPPLPAYDADAAYDRARNVAGEWLLHQVADEYGAVAEARRSQTGAHCKRGRVKRRQVAA